MDSFKINCIQDREDFIEIEIVGNNIVASIDMDFTIASIILNKETAQQLIDALTELKEKL